MRRYRGGLGLWLALAIGGSLSAAELVWQDVPLPLTLSVGAERLLRFPEPVQVGVPGAVSPAILRVQSNGATALLLAQQPFDTQRLQVRLLDSGQVLLFDVQAQAGVNGGVMTEPLTVVRAGAAGGGRTPAITPVTLTRFAAQQFYAPARVAATRADIRRLPMGIPEQLALYRDPSVVGQPQASWQGGGLIVTAIELTNTGPARVQLDPRELTGDLLTATFQHHVLGPVGSATATTHVYVVTGQPLAEVVATQPGGP